MLVHAYHCSWSVSVELQWHADRLTVVLCGRREDEWRHQLRWRHGQVYQQSCIINTSKGAICVGPMLSLFSRNHLANISLIWLWTKGGNSNINYEIQKVQSLFLIVGLLNITSFALVVLFLYYWFSKFNSGSSYSLCMNLFSCKILDIQFFKWRFFQFVLETQIWLFYY